MRSCAQAYAIQMAPSGRQVAPDAAQQFQRLILSGVAKLHIRTLPLADYGFRSGRSIRSVSLDWISPA